MFFLLSKILYFLIQPLNWVIGLLLIALFAKRKSWKKKAVIAAAFLLIFFSNQFLVNQVIRWWEVETITAEEIKEPFDVGILLGGFTNSQIIPGHDRLNFGFSANRFLNAYELYRTGKIRKILITGGTGSVLQNSPKEAIKVKDFLIRSGMPESDILVESESRNTYENAVFTKNILKELPLDSKYLMMTSAFHMRRAERCFKKAGLDFTSFSVDFLTEKDRWNPEYSLIPNHQGLYLWELLIKEWVGYLVYWFQGYL